MKKTYKILTLSLTVILILGALVGCSLFTAPDDPEPEYDKESTDVGTVYTVGDSFFSLLSYMKVDGKVEGTHAVRVAVRADISMHEYTLCIKARNKSGAVILDKEITKKASVDRNSTIVISVEMKEADIDSILDLTLTGSAKSYDNPNALATESRPRVKFMLDGEVWSECAVTKGTPIMAPDVPRIKGEIFAGWYADEELDEPFELTDGVSGATTLYAKIIPDVAELTNRITTTLASSMVTIHAEYKKLSPFSPGATSTSSGIIIKTGAQTLILTCCHSVQIPSGYTYASFEVEDYLGNRYTATPYSVDGVKAIAPEYDLACLVVSGMEGVSEMPLADRNADVGDTVIALGSPGGQQNAISFGEIKKYSLVEIDIEEEMSNVTFPTAYHTAPIKGGSSGGALISCELELVGVNYAGLDDEFGNGYAVPIQKVLEFLEEYVY